MKTSPEIEKEIKDLRFRGNNISVEKLSYEKEKKELTKIKSRIKYLKPILEYMRSEPSKQFVESELKKTQEKLTSIDSRFCPPDGVSGKAIGEMKKSFDAEWGVKKIKTHIKNLKFILKK